MPQLGEILGETIEGAISAVDRAVARRLKQHADVVVKLAGETPGMDELAQMMDAGWTPDFFAGTQMSISASLAMTTQRERQIGAGGGLSFGPVRVEGTYSETFRQGTQTNLVVSVELTRQSRTDGLRYALESLSAVRLPLPGGG